MAYSIRERSLISTDDCRLDSCFIDYSIWLVIGTMMLHPSVTISDMAFIVPATILWNTTSMCSAEAFRSQRLLRCLL
jgi:hypothetical protein